MSPDGTHEASASFRTLKLTVEYDGTDFCGYQSQADGVRTVQSIIADALGQLNMAPVKLIGAGRTDTGVHAIGQVVSVQVSGAVPTGRVAIALNRVLPSDASIVDAKDVDPAFHARFLAKNRTYCYTVWTRRTRSALWGRYSLHWKRPLDIALMRQAAQCLVGKLDFVSFAKAGGSPGPTTVRDVKRIAIRQMSDGRIVLIITANGFLRSMVRNIVGLLLAVGAKDLPPSSVVEILALRDRSKNPIAPAAPHGLCLLRVDY